LTDPKQSWIRFVLRDDVSPQRKTEIWRVISTSAIGVDLGNIAWYSQWRKYCYFVNSGLSLVLDKNCLRDIADFCEEQTMRHYRMLRGKSNDQVA
jgi:hypothetical protein